MIYDFFVIFVFNYFFSVIFLISRVAVIVVLNEVPKLDFEFL